MKTSRVFLIGLVLLVLVLIAVGLFFYHTAPEPEQAFRANLTEAQKLLETMRRAEMAWQQSSGAYKAVSAKRESGKMIYSESWGELQLSGVDTGIGFDFECFPDDGVCQASEVGKTGLSGNGVRIDIETGAYDCVGDYKPVTTEGFDGALVTVACQA